MKKEDIKAGIKFYIENPKRIYKITKLDNDVVTYKSILSGIKYKTPITPSFLSSSWLSGATAFDITSFQSIPFSIPLEVIL